MRLNFLSPKGRARVRIFWLGSLCLFLAGCGGGYQTIPVLTDSTLAEEQVELESGDKVRLSLRDGTLVTGTFDSYRDEGLALYGAKVVSDGTAGFDEVKSVETKQYGTLTAFPLESIVGLAKLDDNEAVSWVVGVTVAAVVYFLIFALFIYPNSD